MQSEPAHTTPKPLTGGRGGGMEEKRPHDGGKNKSSILLSIWLILEVAVNYIVGRSVQSLI